jgi:hypothetical protein
MMIRIHLLTCRFPVSAAVHLSQVVLELPDISFAGALDLSKARKKRGRMSDKAPTPDSEGQKELRSDEKNRPKERPTSVCSPDVEPPRAKLPPRPVENVRNTNRKAGNRERRQRKE